MDKKKLILTAVAGILAVAPAMADEGKAPAKKAMAKKPHKTEAKAAGENHCKTDPGHCGAAAKEESKEMSCGANGCDKGEKKGEKAEKAPETK